MDQMLTETIASGEFVPARKLDEQTVQPLPETSLGVESGEVPQLATMNSARTIFWPNAIWIALMHLGVLLAPFTFSWSGLAICALLHWLTGGLGICLGYHRLLTHRSFQVPKPLEYLLTLLGGLATQGGALEWVGKHRIHHRFSDEPGDPHSPKDGHLWSHMLWVFLRNDKTDSPRMWKHYVPDLLKDPAHRVLHHMHVVWPLALAAGLYLLGGLSWLVWGMFVRTVLVYHCTWFVNYASHVWGYRSFPTRDGSRNLWWVALLSYGEGWHNNHHAFQRSARHGLRWWELDLTYWTIRLMSLVRLARHVQMPHEPSVE